MNARACNVLEHPRAEADRALPAEDLFALQTLPVVERLVHIRDRLLPLLVVFAARPVNALADALLQSGPIVRGIGDRGFPRFGRAGLLEIETVVVEPLDLLLSFGIEIAVAERTIEQRFRMQDRIGHHASVLGVDRIADLA